MQVSVVWKFALDSMKLANDFEILFELDAWGNSQFLAMARSQGVRLHMWMEWLGFLGGDQSILNLQHLTQSVFDATVDNPNW